MSGRRLWCADRQCESINLMPRRRTKPAGTMPGTIEDQFIHDICTRLAHNEKIHEPLPTWGCVHIDRQLPFLCLYRQPRGDRNVDAGTVRLVTGEASYVTSSGARKLQHGISELVGSIAEVLVETFGACLLLEIWSADWKSEENHVAPNAIKPRFRITAPKDTRDGTLLDNFRDALSRVRLGKQKAEVDVRIAQRCAPRWSTPILSNDLAALLHCQLLGLEVAPVYRDPQTGAVLPLVLRELRHRLTIALRRALFEFTRRRTKLAPAHYHVIGRRALVKAVWDVDRALAAGAEKFDFLLQVTPINADQAWNEFRKNNFKRPPLFYYRPSPVDPLVLKRKLYEAPVERVLDPALAQLFREKLKELDTQIDMLSNLNTKHFMYGSVQVFGEVDQDLLRVARQILKRVPPRTRDESGPYMLDSIEFARRAEEEIAFYRKQSARIDAKVIVRDDITGLMVSHGSLLVSRNSKIPATRVDALLQHEVGTHVLTYHNGKAQRFEQLYTGLAGYEALQEGLAVLAEYLVGGLSRPRLRLLAARVVAAHMMLGGATFVETFRRLTRHYEFAARGAFNITLRIYRGGGLTKDACYLRGLRDILRHIGSGGELEPLFVGKIATQHIPIVRELQWRGFVREPPFVPRYMSRPDALDRLDRLRQGMSVLDLIEPK